MIAAKVEQVAELRSLAEKASAAMSQTPPSGTPNVNRMEDIIVKMVDLQAEVQTDVDRLLVLKRNITDAINHVQDTNHKMVLELRYLNYKPWKAVAAIMRYNISHVYALHVAALSAIEVPSENAHIYLPSKA